jgi:UPF0755 protein
MLSKLKWPAAFLLLLFLSVGIWMIWEWRRPCKLYSEEEKFVEVPKGAGSYRISRILEREGIIRHWIWFLTYVKLARRDRPLQAGEYQFSGPVTISQIADKLFYGRVYYHEITIPEGYSQFEISQLLEQSRLATPEDFYREVRRVEWIQDLAPQAQSLEGFLFPDTYRFSRHVSAEQIVRTMVDRFRHVHWEALSSEKVQSPFSLLQLVTLASLIEKETGLASERELVSAVLQNRLKIGMALQCDPTVIYAAKLNGSYRGEINHADLGIHSFYNTYQKAGLPPGPIANPGLGSFQAALHPAHVDYLYFVSNNQGGHVFSKSLDEHNRAVAAYRRGLKSQSMQAGVK